MMIYGTIFAGSLENPPISAPLHGDAARNDDYGHRPSLAFASSARAKAPSAGSVVASMSPSCGARHSASGSNDASSDSRLSARLDSGPTQAPLSDRRSGQRRNRRAVLLR